jgi:hypothetical protein
MMICAMHGKKKSINFSYSCVAPLSAMYFLSLTNTYYVQAGLFSATVTAFTIESYKWLKEANDDMSVRILAFVATQLSNSSSTIAPPPEIYVAPFTVTSSEVRINAAFFLSLTLSLSTVLLGIMCLQWLREYRRDVALPHKEAIALRQMRYEGLIAWHVPEILSALPVILQTSLLLFFIGILDLLWARHWIVATCVTVVVGIVMTFLAITSALPALQHAFVKDRHLRVHQCPYKSPQSWLAYKFGHMILWFIDSLNFRWANESHRFHRLLKSTTDLNWMTFDMRWRQLRDAQDVVRGTAKSTGDSDDIIHGLQWINNTFMQSVDAVYPIENCIIDLDLSAAASTVSGFYLDGLIDNTTLRVMLDDRFSPTENQKRDILSAYYLHLHKDRHRVLKLPYLESLLRILNSQEVPQRFYDLLSEILNELASSPPSSDTFSIMNHEIDVQILLCMKGLMKRSGRSELRTLDLVVAWALLHHLLTSSLVECSEDRVGGMNVDHLKLACGMFEEFEHWISRGREIERCDRVKLCAEGMITVFPPSIDLVWLRTFCPDMEKALSLVNALEVQVEALGGPSAVLSREKRWWLDYWEAYTGKDWSEFVENFKHLEQA